MIVADNIALQRGNKTLFDRASFRFEQPGFVAIIGPNGAGKSTLLQLLSGFYTPTQGKVLIHGSPAGSWKPAELAKYRAYLQQQQSVFETFSVEDVLMMGRSIHFRSCPKKEDVELVTRTLAGLELLERRHQPFNHLSGGEQQRVQFARTLLQLQETGSDSLKGKVLFLDEPLNNLDLYYQYNLLQMARNSVVDRGGIVVAVLHDLNMASRFADRVIVLSAGKTIIDAPANEALEPELLSAIYQMNIEKIEPLNQLPYFAVTSMPAMGSALNVNRMAAQH
jgi:iron complex transport system ATP-binding protein